MSKVLVKYTGKRRPLTIGMSWLNPETSKITFEAPDFDAFMYLKDAERLCEENPTVFSILAGSPPERVETDDAEVGVSQAEPGDAEAEGGISDFEELLRQEYLYLSAKKFSDWVFDKMDVIETLSQSAQNDIETKWNRLYPDMQYPLTVEASPDPQALTTTEE